MESIVSTITEIVPQMTYDIIARFAPGTMVILSWAIVANGSTWNELDELLKDINSISGWSVLLFLLVAYIVSIVLYGIWILAETIWEKSKPTPASYRPSMYDAIRIVAPSVGARIVKLRAEARQAQVLIVGWGIASLQNLVLCTRCCSTYRIWLGLALLVGIIGADSFRRYIKRKYVDGIKSHGAILRLEQEPWAGDTQSENWLARIGQSSTFQHKES